MSSNRISFQQRDDHAINSKNFIKKKKSYKKTSKYLLIQINEENEQIKSEIDHTIPQMLSNHSTIVNFSGIINTKISGRNFYFFVN